MSQNNLKVCLPCRILLAVQCLSKRTATSQTSLSHPRTRVNSHGEREFLPSTIAQPAHHGYINASADASRGKLAPKKFFMTSIKYAAFVYGWY